MAGVGTYIFTTLNDTYSDLTGATTFAINGGNGTIDDGFSLLQSIGFDFQFGDATVSFLSVGSNGYLRLGIIPIGNTNNAILSTSNTNVICFNNKDLDNTGATYSIKTEGIAPSRICKIEAKNFYQFGGIGSKLGNAQVWLYETSNVVEIRYGTYSATWTGTVNTYVGLKGISTATTELNVINSATWAGVTNSSNVHVTTGNLKQTLTNQVTSGTVFRFEPLLPLSLTITTTPPTCGVTWDGTVTATFSGGVPPYILYWGDNCFQFVDPATSPEVLTGTIGCPVAAGDYIAELYDSLSDAILVPYTIGIADCYTSQTIIF